MSVRIPLPFMLAGALLATAAVGCGDDGPPRTSASVGGELGQGRFVYRCDNSIADCNPQGDATVFPDAVVSGGTFELEFLPENQDITGITLESASSEILEKSPKGFTGQKAGFGTVLAKDSSGRIVDFRSVEIVIPDHIGVYESAAEGRRPDAPDFLITVELELDKTRALRALGRTDTGDPLAGVVGYEWSTDNKEIATIETFSRDSVTIKGRKEGTTQLVIKGSGKEERIDLVVKAGATQ